MTPFFWFILELQKDISIDDLRKIFEYNVHALVDKHVESGTESSKKNKPSVTEQVRQIIKMKQRTYLWYGNHGKAFNNAQSEKSDTLFRTTVQGAEARYYEELDSILKANPNTFWKSVKAKKKDDASFPPLPKYGQLN